MGKAILMGVSPKEFWLMEVYELNCALEEYEDEKREKLMMWRLSNYIAARPHMDPKKHVPTIEEFYPFPWDKEYRKESRFIPYDEQIEFAMNRKVEDWIPNHWYVNSTKYQHLAKNDGKAGNLDGSGGIETATEPTQAAS